MKRFIRFGVVFLTVLFSFLLFGCSNDEITIESVVIKSSSVEQAIDIADFDITDLILIVTFSDDRAEEIQVTETMISAADLEKLSYMGTHAIVVNYQKFKVNVTVEITDIETTTLLADYYEYAVQSLGYQGNYFDWLISITNNPLLTVIHAEVNQANEIVITLSNKETRNLGTMNIETFTVSFYGFNGILLSTITVPKGGLATPPVIPTVESYQFVGWDVDFFNIQTNLSVHAIYQYTETPLSDIDDADALLISINRLEQAQFEVNLDDIFKNTSNTNTLQRSRSLSSILKSSTTLDASNPYDINNYTPHTYWQQFYYHKGLYQQPSVIDGYHVITSTLTSHSNHSLNNLYETTESVTSQARERADWAVENITVMDTWVTIEYYKYLLHYDEALDRVELYTIWTYEPHFVTSYEKIYVYYNHKGEEVIESWVEQVYSEGSYPGVMGYHNSVAGRDFNFYFIWLDENFEPTSQRMCRGINLTSEGYYEYYENHNHMVSGDYGWYTIQPTINHIEQKLDYSSTPSITVFSPDASTNVMTIYPFGGGDYMVDLYLPSMNGIEAILVEEGGMYETNQDSEDTRQFLVDQGFLTMPNWWAMDVWDIDITSGFRTSTGTYIAERGSFSEKVNFRSLNLNIGSEGIREYDHLYNYYGVATFYVNESSINNLVQTLFLYFQSIGLSYKFGDTDLLFKELGYVYQNYESIGRKVSITNDVMGAPNETYTSYEHVIAVEEYIKNHLNTRSLLTQMETEYNTMSFYDLPSKSDLNSITLIDTASNVTGELSVVNSKLDTSQITATLNRSPLLQNNASYSLFYALKIGGRLIELAHEDPLVFTGENLAFTGNLTIDIPNDLEPGEYQLVTFFAKVVGDSFLRISNVIPSSVGTFETINETITNEDEETSVETTIYHSNNSLNLTIVSKDIFTPKVTIAEGETVYRGDAAINTILLPYGSKVSDLLNLFNIMDNADGWIIPTVDMITHNDQNVLLDDLLTDSGWKLEVSDKSGNKTTIEIGVIEFAYLVTFMSNDFIYYQVLVKAGETVTLPIDPEKQDDVFVRWDTEDLVITEHRVINAIYQSELLTVKFLVHGTYYQIDYVLPGSKITAPIDPEKEGQIFAGWYDNTYYQGEMVDFDLLVITTDLNLFAKFVLNP